MLLSSSWLKSRYQYLLAILVWLLFWIIPWGRWIPFLSNPFQAFVVDMFRLAAALILFIFPGVLLYILLQPDDGKTIGSAGIMPVGFTFSVMLVAVIGLFGRLAGFPFVWVKIIFASTTVLMLVLLMLFKPGFSISRKDLLAAARALLTNAPLCAAVFLAAALTFHDSLLFIDDTTYLAYITSWQRSIHLGFDNIIHVTGARESARFWLALYPMGQALLSDLSGIPGILLLGNYLELLLVPLAVLTSYWFARVLGLSQKLAGLSTLIQVSLISWMIGEQFPVGMWFYQNLSEDKSTAAFILAPVFFVLIMQFYEHPSRRRILMVSLVGIALTLTHPVILFFACLIAGGLLLCFWLAGRTNWRVVLQSILIFACLMVPYLLIRVFDDQARNRIPYDARSVSESYENWRYTNVISDVFYGINPGVLEFVDIPRDSGIYGAYQVFRFLPVFLALLAGVVAFLKRCEGPLAWYILVCDLSILFATVPYTGWILGYFSSARLLSRISWFLPLGLGAVLVIHWLQDRGRQRSQLTGSQPQPKDRQHFRMVTAIFVCIAFTSPWIAFVNIPRAHAFFDMLHNNQLLAQVGDYIDRTSAAPVTVIALDYRSTQLLPGVSAHANLISFREEKPYNGHNDFLSLEQIEQRKSASDTIRSLSPAIPPEQRCLLIEQYGVRYILVNSQDLDDYERLLDACGGNVRAVFESGDQILLEWK